MKMVNDYKYPIKYMVEFDFQDGKAMQIKFFIRRWQAEKFAEENNGKVYAMQEVKA